MINNALRRKIKSSMDAVRTELKKRGFSDSTINDFEALSNFTECLKVLNFVAEDSDILAWNSRYRFSLIVADCAVLDKKRILYGLRKNNVNDEMALLELGKRYRKHFVERCPKILAHSQKIRAMEEIMKRMNSLDV